MSIILSLNEVYYICLGGKNVKSKFSFLNLSEKRAHGNVIFKCIRYIQPLNQSYNFNFDDKKNLNLGNIQI